MRNSGSTTVHTGNILKQSYERDYTGNKPGSAIVNQAGKLIPLNYETVPDEVLVELYKTKRDQEALSNIIKRYRDTIFGFALKLTKDYSDAEDVFQDISLTLVNKLSTFKGNSKFSTWLYKVTLNASYMVLNKKKKTTKYELTTEYVYENSAHGIASPGRLTLNPLCTALYKESSEIIIKALNEISGLNRKIIMLKDMQGHTNAEIAQKLGISVPAVKSSLLRSRLLLRKKLGLYFRDRK